MFSGDFLFPSNLSTFFEGEQMFKPINSCNIDVSCLGNHELELGIDHGTAAIKKLNFPTVMTNLLDIVNNEQPLC